MIETDGDGRPEWLDKHMIYATLSLCEDVQEASEALQEQGLEISPRRLGYYQRHGAHRIKQMRESGLVNQLVGQLARHKSRIEQMDHIADWFTRVITQVDDPQTLDTGKAAMLHRYRELMALLIDADSPGGISDADEQVSEEDEQRVESGLSLLELVSNGRSADETFEQLLLDTARRVAAASGATFRAPEPALPPLE